MACPRFARRALLSSTTIGKLRVDAGSGESSRRHGFARTSRLYRAEVAKLRVGVGSRESSGRREEVPTPAVYGVPCTASEV